MHPYTFPIISASPGLIKAMIVVEMAAIPEANTKEPIVGSCSSASKAFLMIWSHSS